jgi:DNA-binding NarL/FixJ family response regulator
MGRRDDVLSALTARENKIMKEVALGLTNKEIAIKLLLSDNTVKRYMTQIMQKLHVRNRLEAVLLLRTRGILMSDNGA